MASPRKGFFYNNDASKDVRITQNDIGGAMQAEQNKGSSPINPTAVEKGLNETQNEVGAMFSAAAGKSAKVENKSAPVVQSSVRCFVK